MLVDLVQTTTRDGLRLDGVFRSPDRPSAADVDAFRLVHGTGANFAGSSTRTEPRWWRSTSAAGR